MASIASRNELETTRQHLSRTTVPVADNDLQLPVLEGRHVTLRALRPSDAPSLHSLLTTTEVARFISAPPATVDAFERFIARINRQRSTGRHMCYAVTLKDSDTAIGMFQIRELEPKFQTAEWGFALGSPFWGTGVFTESAQLILQFVFVTLGVYRLEARAAVRNGRGGRALQKMGAVQEGVLRRSFRSNGEYLDQVLYAIIQDDWRASRASVRPAVVLH
jgi:ribosomal-protein-alanine N-acetyltransferase